VPRRGFEALAPVDAVMALAVRPTIARRRDRPPESASTWWEGPSGVPPPIHGGRDCQDAVRPGATTVPDRREAGSLGRSDRPGPPPEDAGAGEIQEGRPLPPSKRRTRGARGQPARARGRTTLRCNPRRFDRARRSENELDA